MCRFLYGTLCFLLVSVSASGTTVLAAQCEAEVHGRYHNPTEEDVLNLREMVEDAEEGLSELESLVVRSSEDVVIAREATMKVAPLVALAGEPDEVGSMAARGYLSRRGVEWGASVHKDVKHSLYEQPHTVSEPGETTPLLNDAIHSAPNSSGIGSIAFKWAGRGFMILGIGASLAHVYAADDHTEAAVVEGASWAASLYAAEAAGVSCAATGAEVIVPLCVIIGGVMGGQLGQTLGAALFHSDDPYCYDSWTGVDSCIWTARPPI